MNLAELIATHRATINVEEYAELHEISRGLAYKLHRDGTLPGALTLGRRRLVSVIATLRALGVEDDAQDTGEPAAGGDSRAGPGNEQGPAEILRGPERQPTTTTTILAHRTDRIGNRRGR